MKKFLIAIGAVFALTACGGGGAEPAPEEAPAEDVTEDAGEEATGDFDATAAREVYEASCIGCHGGNLQGAGGPALAGENLTPDQIVHVILNGQGTMPAINIDPEEAENLAEWIAVQ